MANKKRTIIISLCVLLVAAALFGIYSLVKGSGQQGEKKITLKVVGTQDAVLYDETLRTDAQSLSALLQEKAIAEMQSSSYGNYIVAVKGLRADSGQQQWWHISLNGEDAMVGADELMIKDGDSLVLTFKTGY